MSEHSGSEATDSTESDDGDRRYDSEPARVSKRARTHQSGHETRRGKWSVPEEAFAARLILNFESGLLQLENGSTLRAFLSKKLNCSAMRISKKFAGEKCLGKQIYARRDIDAKTRRDEDALLTDLEDDFLTSVRGNNAPTADHHQLYHHRATGSSYGVKKQRDLVEEGDSKLASYDDVTTLATATLLLASDDEDEVVVSMEDELSNIAARKPRPLSFRKLGSSSKLSGLMGSVPAAQHHHLESREAMELADAHARANMHNTKSFEELPRADLIQSPPSALMLELAPQMTRRPPAQSSSCGMYAFSIARGFSSSSLAKLHSFNSTDVFEDLQAEADHLDEHDLLGGFFDEFVVESQSFSTSTPAYYGALLSSAIGGGLR